MSLRAPKLDDRTFQQLVDEALERVRSTCPTWTDLHPGDPGVTLIEAFAYLTELLLYRLNRLPTKAYIELLRLLGVRLRPPAAAVVELVFTLKAPREAPVLIPGGTRVTSDGSGREGAPPIFRTDRALEIPAGATRGSVTAHHCEWVEAESLGRATGLPGFSGVVARPPIVAPLDELDLVVAVEALEEELAPGTPSVRHGERLYRQWHEVGAFAEAEDDPYVYVTDRLDGRITFAPAALLSRPAGGLSEAAAPLAAVPSTGRDIMVWYRTGGGSAGNVAAGELTKLVEEIPDVTVSNPEAATGGRDAETIENAVLRGPYEFRSRERAVTARDYEAIALHEAGVARARAAARGRRWKHARDAALVEVLIMPEVPGAADDGRLPLERIRAQQTGEALESVRSKLYQRQPLGVRTSVAWARCKPIVVEARVVAHPHASPAVVRERLEDRLNRMIAPISLGGGYQGWSFGHPIYGASVIEAMMAEAGVSHLETMVIRSVEAPVNAPVRAVVADPHEDGVWYAGCGGVLFRSENQCVGWEHMHRFEEGSIEAIVPDPDRAGHLALLLGHESEQEHRSTLAVSQDCGESWRIAARPRFDINDVAWCDRQDARSLLLATDRGLYLQVLDGSGGPVQIVVDADNETLGFSCITVDSVPRGEPMVIVAARQTRGIFISPEGGAPGSFGPWGLEGENVETLVMQRLGSRRFVWAGIAAMGGAAGSGAARRELRLRPGDSADWEQFGRDWEGGSCRCLVFTQSRVLAGSYRAGVLSIDPSDTDARWQKADISCGLPLTQAGQLEEINGLACAVDGSLIVVGTDPGLYASEDGGTRYEEASRSVSRDRITIPPTWLICSGTHAIEVGHEATEGSDAPAAPEDEPETGKADG